jgi:hypothetical protein
VIAWDCQTGQRVAEPSSNQILNSSRIAKSPNGRWFAFVRGKDVLLIDQDFRNTPNERRFRKVQAGPKPRWHVEHFNLAEEKNDGYAAVFHAAALVASDPNDPSNRNRYAAAAEKYTKDQRRKNGSASTIVVPPLARNIK